METLMKRAPLQDMSDRKKESEGMIIGANGKIGLLCAYAAKDKLAGTGSLTGIVKSERSKEEIAKYGIFDEILLLNAANTENFYKLEESDTEKYDIVINCVNSPNTEMASLLFVKDKGIIYFATLSSDYKLTSMTAVGWAKSSRLYLIRVSGDVRTIPESGAEYRELRELLQ
jgi:NADPH:quinone reductase-like Zn-dependent oxidoreductase